MAFSLNRVTLVGRLGQDPELRTIPSGAQVCTFSVATDESYLTNGEWKKETEWHRVVCWVKLAEQASKNLKKGSMICVEGKIKRREYDKDGIKQYMTEIRAMTLVFLEKGEKSEYGDSSYSQTKENNMPSTVADSGNDDDIPF